MINRIKSALNNKGFTLLELILSMVVLSLIMIAVTAVFVPMLRTFERANNLAEANTLLDNLSALIMEDVTSATSFSADPGTSVIDVHGEINDVIFIVRTSYFIEYYVDSEGILCRRAPGLNGPVLQKDFYKYRGEGTVFSIDATGSVNDGVVSITLTLTADFGWSLTREYSARPVGLAV